MKMASILFVVCVIQIPVTQHLEDCDLKKNADGINVYTCKSGDKKLRSLKADFVLKNSTLQDLEYFLLHVENYPTWQYNMIEAEMIQPAGDHEVTYQAVVDAPWPVENREMVINLVIMRDETNQRMRIETKNIDSSIPGKEGTIRVPYMLGIWKVVKEKNDLQVEYYLQIDPGGSVPAWLVNLAMAEGPYISFRNLKKQLEK